MDDAKIPINASHDFQLGVVFSRLDIGDKRMDGLEKRLGDFGEELKEVNVTILKVKDDMVSEVKVALAAQTLELKPVLTEKMVRDANALSARERRGDLVNVCLIIGAIFSVLSICVALISGGITLLTKNNWSAAHPLPVQMHNPGGQTNG